MAKLLMSKLLLENSNKPVLEEKDDEEALVPITPKPRNLDFSEDMTEVVWETPKRSACLQRQLRQFQNLKEPSTITTNLLARKLAKGYDIKDLALAQAQTKIHKLQKEVEILRPKKRKRVLPSPNSKFIRIEDIWKAKMKSEGIEDSSEDEESDEESIDTNSCIEVITGRVVIDD